MVTPRRQPNQPQSKRLRFDSPEQEAFLQLWRTYDCLKAREDELFGEFGLSAQQYNALRLLRWRHPASMATQALGRRLISRGPDVTRMLDRLEKRGFVERVRRDENRRVVEIKITTSGCELLNDLDLRVRRMHTRQLGHLNRAELKELIDLLKRARAPHEDTTCDWLD